MTASPSGAQAPTVMVVTGETSGDIHGARLVAALRRRRPDLHFCGMGGPAMAAAGVELLADSGPVAVVGLVEIFSHLPAIAGAMFTLRRVLARRRPPLLVCIDLPDFNLPLARYAHRLGIPVLYYICPQVWAWRPGRARRIARIARHLAVILPFEEPFFAAYGGRVTYVGHPLLDDPRLIHVRRQRPAPGNTAAGPPTIALLPGSRRGEIENMLPLFLAAARQLRCRFPACRFLLVQAPEITRATLDGCGLAEANDLAIEIVDHGQRYEPLATSTAALAASGTVTLELALLDVPAVVAYRTHPLTYAVGRRLVSVSHCSLVNLIAGRTVVPECLQDEATPEVLANHLAELCCGPAPAAQREGYAEVRRRLGAPGAAHRVAALAMDILQGSPVQ